MVEFGRSGPGVTGLSARQIEQIGSVIETAQQLGRAAVAAPDLDPDAAFSTRFLMNHLLPTAGTTIYSGNGSSQALRQRAPHFANMRIRPIAELDEQRACEQPLFLLDASRIDQPNVGGRSGVIPAVVLDTHFGQNPLATEIAILSSAHVATGSIVTELAQAFFPKAEFWEISEVRRDAAALRFGIYTDSGEDNYATAADRLAMEFLSAHQDQETWNELQNSPFFLKVDSLYNLGARIYEVNNGFLHVDFPLKHLDGCRDYLGAVADRLLHHINGICVLATGVIRRGAEHLLCVALRLNRLHRALEKFDPEYIFKTLADLGGGYGSQVNGLVWGGSLVTKDPSGDCERILERYNEYSVDIHNRLGSLSF